MIKVASHIGYHLAGPGEPFAPESRPFQVPPSDFERNVKPWVQDRLASIVDASAPVHSETCLYSSTPDEDFIIDDVSGLVGQGRFGASDASCPASLPRGSVVLCAGFSGHGFKLAPTVGAIAASIAVMGEAGLGEASLDWLGGASAKDTSPGNRTGAAGSIFSIARF
jgi:glycine/D-amino acid oxidase-like deaminating enzyme